MHHNQGPPVHISGARKYLRFELQFPVLLSFAVGEMARELEGVSKNVSLGGVLVNTVDEIPLRTKVRLRMDIVRSESMRPVKLSAKGEVVRVELLPSGHGYVVAVKCDRLITQVRDLSRVCDE